VPLADERHYRQPYDLRLADHYLFYVLYYFFRYLLGFSDGAFRVPSAPL
jgi:hypothetical protein